MEIHKNTDSTVLNEKRSRARIDSSSHGSWRLYVASFLGWLSVIWAVPASLVSLPIWIWALSSTPDDSEWGRFGVAGSMVALIWLGAIAVLVFALVLSACASVVTTGSTRKGRFIGLGVLGVVTVTNVSLWLVAYASESGVWLSPRGVWEIFRWIAEVGGLNVVIEAVTCLAATVGLAILLTVLNVRRTQRPKPTIEATGVSAKSRLATSFLALLLGVFGAHRFYVGKKGTGAATLGLLILAFALHLLDYGIHLTWVWYATQFMLVAAFLWAFADFGSAISGRMMDSRGRPIKNW